VDDIVLTGGIVHSADFETDDDGWTIAPFAEGIGGEWTRLMARDDLPAPDGGDCSMVDSVLVMFDPSTNGHSLFQSNLAVSPWIDLTGAGLIGLPGKFIELEGYFDLSSLSLHYS